jgi:hypothetical protein
LAEIIDRTPGNIGLSIEFTGDDEEIKGEKFARCDEIFAATIVDLPAANPTGFFAVKLTKEDEEVNRNTDRNESNGEDDMTDEQIEKLAASLGKTVTTALAPVIQKLEEKKPDDSGNGNGNGDDDEKEEMAAAGVAAGDDDATKKQKIEAYRASKQTVSTMSSSQLSEVIKKNMMQFFSQTGGKPAKVTVEPEGEGGDPFETRIKKHMELGANFRGLAINRARRDAPKEYNEWMAKNHPRVQHMERK